MRRRAFVCGALGLVAQMAAVPNAVGQLLPAAGEDEAAADLGIAMAVGFSGLPGPSAGWDWDAPARDFSAPRSGSRRSGGRLFLYNTHTAETVDVSYSGGQSDHSDTLGRISHFFRDWRTGTVRSIDPALVDLLEELQAETGSDKPLHLLSGYRTPETNAMLARQMGGVATHSLHMQAKAADIYMPGYDLARLHRHALAMGRGGVGYYPANGFIHVDTGTVRTWTTA